MNGGRGPNDIDPQKKSLIDNMSLEDLRSFFMDEHRKQEDVENAALRAREKGLIDELNIMKVEKQKVKEEREKEEQELADLLGEFKHRKDVEIQAKIETDQINKELREN